MGLATLRILKPRYSGHQFCHMPGSAQAGARVQAAGIVGGNRHSVIPGGTKDPGVDVTEKKMYKTESNYDLVEST